MNANTNTMELSPEKLNNKGELVAIAWPGKDMNALFEKHQDVIFYNQHGWMLLDINNERFFQSSLNIKHSHPLIDPVEIHSKINKWLPVIYRWSRLGVEIEQLLSQTTLLIANLVCEINFLKIKTFIFHTGVPHHYDSMVLSIACEIAEVKQIFLYANVFDGALIPLLQKGSMTERTVLSWKGGKIDYSKLIDEYISKRLQGTTPTTSDPQTFASNWWKCNIFLALGYAIYLRTRRNLSSFRCSIMRLDKAALPELKEYSLVDFVKILLSQLSYITEYKNNCISYATANNYSANSESVQLLIAAHYQPEATSFPEGWDYYSHIDIALKVRSLGYTNDLYYKEHYGTKFYLERYVGLTRVGLCRSKSYLNGLLELGCKLISPDAPVPLQSNFVPLTITGTIAIERALLGLRTIVFGRPWYLGLPGTIHINDIKSLHSIPMSWTIPDVAVANDAKDFLLKLLSNNTMTNVAGIGVGKGFTDLQSLKNFQSECFSLLNLIKTLGRNFHSPL
jgi:hypothetical protein